MIKKVIYIFLFFWFSANAQRLFDESKNIIINKHSLKSFTNKLANNKPVSIVHIGDSHIQANFFTGHLRKLFQENFGRASRGITFPLRLAKTHGHSDIKFYSNIEWNSTKIIDDHNTNVGLCGATLSTTSPSFYIKIVNKKDIEANQIKIIGKGLAKLKFGISKKEIKSPDPIFTSSIYKVKSGDYLIKIARKFKTTLAYIKRCNNLRSDRLKINQKLKIRKKSKTTAIPININDFNLIEPIFSSDQEITIELNENLSDIYIISNEIKSSLTKIDGVFINNYSKGVTYHSIGINGAKFSDYNTSTLFFKQLSYTNPDVIIVSLGTNSSFDKHYHSENFYEDAKLFLNKIREYTNCNSLLITTPPSSLIKKRVKNKKLEEFQTILQTLSKQENYALWDLLSIMGANNINYWLQKKLAAKDKIHYTKDGYELQADLLFKSLTND